MDLPLANSLREPAEDGSLLWRVELLDRRLGSVRAALERVDRFIDDRPRSLGWIFLRHDLYKTPGAPASAPGFDCLLPFRLRCGRGGFWSRRGGSRWLRSLRRFFMA